MSDLHTLATERDAAGFAPIASYAPLGEGRTVALLSRDGRIDWLPIPALDSPPVFAAIIDDAGGYIALRPAGVASATRRYLPRTNVMETTWTSASGTAIVQDALIMGAGGPLPWTQLDRVVRGVSGAVRFEWSVRPGTALGRGPVEIALTPNAKTLRVGPVTMTVQTTHPRADDDREPCFRGTFTVRPGEEAVVSLVAVAGQPLPLPPPNGDAVARTVRAWEDWSAAHHYTGPHPDLVRRSTLVLKLLTSARTGAIAAAATTSLPESGAGGKNWDYRFAWIRDLTFTVRALTRFGLTEETHAAVTWMFDTIDERHADMPIFYALDGTAARPMVEVPVSGWRHIGPVWDGNRASHQRQLGVYGSIFAVAEQYVRAGHVLDDRGRRVLERLAVDVCKNWRRRDAGLWELPRTRHYTSSKLGCWQALDAAVALAEDGHLDGDVARWRRVQGRIRRWIDAHAWDRRLQAYTMSPGRRVLDASVLLYVGAGFPSAERMASTVEAIRAGLGCDGLVYRFGGAEDVEAPFVACGWWLVSALARLGRATEAARLADRLAATANDVGVFAEMTDADGTHWGNTPQALSHLALINAALDLEAT